MKVFVSYKYGLENVNKLKENISQVCNAIENNNCDSCCLFWREEEFRRDQWPLKKIFQHSFNEIEDSDVVLVFVNSSELTTGMFVEAGYAFAKNKRVVLLINKNVQSNLLRGLIDECIEFENFNELTEKLKELTGC